MKKLAILVYLLSFSCLCNCSYSQEKADVEITPERMGFTPLTIETSVGNVNFFMATEGGMLDKSKKLPLVLFLEGSGPTPLFWGEGNQIGSSMMFEPRDFSGYHFAVISKPGLNFHEKQHRVESEVYDRLLSLPRRVDAANAVINHLVKEDFVDSTKVLLVGHSEGSDVVPWVGAENPNVTHVVGLAPGGVSQMFDFILFVRKQVASKQLTVEEGDEQIRQIKDDFRKIFADPKSTTKKWQGETYLRWSTFFRPSMEAWCKIDKPVFLGICRDDANTPAECGEAIELEFIRLGKTNLTSKVYPYDHYFMEFVDGPENPPQDRRLEALGEVLKWVDKTSATK